MTINIGEAERLARQRALRINAALFRREANSCETKRQHRFALVRRQPPAEEDELTSIYVRRGLEPELARSVARQLMAKSTPEVLTEPWLE